MKMIDLQKLCTYLVSMNNQSEKHIGYCGISKPEVFHTLTEDFSDLPLKESFYIHSNQGHIMGHLVLMLIWKIEARKYGAHLQKIMK